MSLFNLTTARRLWAPIAVAMVLALGAVVFVSQTEATAEPCMKHNQQTGEFYSTECDTAKGFGVLGGVKDLIDGVTPDKPDRPGLPSHCVSVRHCDSLTPPPETNSSSRPAPPEPPAPSRPRPQRPETNAPDRPVYETSEIVKTMPERVVKQLQEALGIDPDGSYGPDTVAAVKAMQKAKGLAQDGIAGDLSFGVLEVVVDGGGGEGSGDGYDNPDSIDAEFEGKTIPKSVDDVEYFTIPGNKLPADVWIPPGTQIHSNNGKFRMDHQWNGDTVIYGPDGPVWNTGVIDPGRRLVLQLDGNLVSYSPSGQKPWDTGTQGTPDVEWLRLSNDGTFQLIDKAGDVVWSSGDGDGDGPIKPRTESKMETTDQAFGSYGPERSDSERVYSALDHAQSWPIEDFVARHPRGGEIDSLGELDLTDQYHNGEMSFMDWDSPDMCTLAPDNFVDGTDARPACLRHDFCVASLQAAGLESTESRGACDENFRTDLQGLCDRHWDGTAVDRCNVSSEAYFKVVDAFTQASTKSEFDDDSVGLSAADLAELETQITNGVLTLDGDDGGQAEYDLAVADWDPEIEYLKCVFLDPKNALKVKQAMKLGVKKTLTAPLTIAKIPGCFLKVGLSQPLPEMPSASGLQCNPLGNVFQSCEVLRAYYETDDGKAVRDKMARWNSSCDSECRHACWYLAAIHFRDASIRQGDTDFVLNNYCGQGNQ